MEVSDCATVTSKDSRNRRSPRARMTGSAGGRRTSERPALLCSLLLLPVSVDERLQPLRFLPLPLLSQVAPFCLAYLAPAASRQCISSPNEFVSSLTVISFSLTYSTPSRLNTLKHIIRCLHTLVLPFLSPVLPLCARTRSPPPLALATSSRSAANAPSRYHKEMNVELMSGSKFQMNHITSEYTLCRILNDGPNARRSRCDPRRRRCVHDELHL